MNDPEKRERGGIEKTRNQEKNGLNSTIFMIYFIRIYHFYKLLNKNVTCLSTFDVKVTYLLPMIYCNTKKSLVLD